MLNGLIQAAKTINQTTERAAFYANKAVEDREKAGRIIASTQIAERFARRLAGYEAGETIVKNYRERIDAGSGDFTTLKFEVNLRNLIRKGYAETAGGNLVLTEAGYKWLDAFRETTCILTGGKTSGKF